MVDHEVHEPDYSETTAEDWDDPRLNDCEISERSSDGTRDPQSGSRGSDDQSEVAEHFVLSASGFPPEDFSDLKVPVVDRLGPLDAVAAAVGGPERIEVQVALGIDDDTVEEARGILEGLAEDGFDVGSDELESPPE